LNKSRIISPQWTWERRRFSHLIMPYTRRRNGYFISGPGKISTNSFSVRYGFLGWLRISPNGHPNHPFRQTFSHSGSHFSHMEAASVSSFQPYSHMASILQFNCASLFTHVHVVYFSGPSVITNSPKLWDCAVDTVTQTE
jgi:hypothetical protein